MKKTTVTWICDECCAEEILGEQLIPPTGWIVAYVHGINIGFDGHFCSISCLLKRASKVNQEIEEARTQELTN